MSGKSTKKTDIHTQAYIHLARREHTRDELAGKLLRKGYERESINRVLETLLQEGVLSHTRFIDDYIESREKKGYGPSRIRAELRHKGLDGDEIERGLNDVEIDWLSSAQHCYRRKYQETEIKDTTDRLKRKRYLFQRGYPEEIIREIVE